MQEQPFRAAAAREAQRLAVGAATQKQSCLAAALAAAAREAQRLAAGAACFYQRPY
tara:strand:+ start:152 stop:319 length:168 start_codon:yes stop_codon:yes gene_type:complete